MKKDTKINLSPLDELFATEEQRQDNKLERVQEIAIDELQPFRMLTESMPLFRCLIQRTLQG